MKWINYLLYSYPDYKNLFRDMFKPTLLKYVQANPIEI